MAAFPRRRLFAREVIQTSAMDCGPAALKALLEGFGIPVSYGRLREACQTDVDGTSIDTLEEIATQLGLDAQQILVPLDHVLLDEAQALPAIAVVRSASGTAHFVVAWRRHGSRVQVMDPARGRLWMPRQAFLDQMVAHSMNVSSAAWRQWAGTESFLRPLQRRLQDIGLSKRAAAVRIKQALDDGSWRSLAAIDAGARMIASLQAAGALKHRHAASMLQALTSRESDHSPVATIADHYWSVRSSPPDAEHAETLNLRGAVLVKVSGRRTEEPEVESASKATATTLSPELAAALSEPPVPPLRALWRAMKGNGLIAPTIAAVAVLIAVSGVTFEAVLLRSALEIGTLLGAPEQGLWAVAALTAFATALLGIEWVLASTERRMGSHLEGRLRLAFLDKIPRLADAYFQSRPVADMLERSHTVHTIRMLPRLGLRFVRVGLELIVTAIALAWLSPGTAGLALAAAAAAAAIPLLGHSFVAERDLRARTHTGALARFHLEALLGKRAIDAHGAAGTLEREHESLLGEWAGAVLSLQRASIAIEAVQLVVGFGLVMWMVMGHLDAGATSAMLLQVYWLLNLPTLGYELALIAREYPTYRSTIVRLLEPLGAPDFRTSQSLPTTARGETASAKGVHIQARQVAVRAAGHTILEEIELDIPAGAHVAIVGPSGAGKSTLVGLLLGWHRPVEGELSIDGEVLTTERMDHLRRRIAWVDPTVQIWNRSLLENLLYGSDNTDEVGVVLEMAGLLPVVAKLPQGLATPLGEGGKLLSAGEAQRVRLARAMLRRDTRLVVFDEPFLGLERERRRTLLARSRQRWSQNTLVYVTHDVVETRAFDRVVVLENGRVVEQGEPLQLAQSLTSRYRRLLQAQESLQNRIAASNEWKRIRLDGGRLVGDHVRANEQTA